MNLKDKKEERFDGVGGALIREANFTPLDFFTRREYLEPKLPEKPL